MFQDPQHEPEYSAGGAEQEALGHELADQSRTRRSQAGGPTGDDRWRRRATRPTIAATEGSLMATFIIAPHMRLHEWIVEEKGYFRDTGLAYEFREPLNTCGFWNSPCAGYLGGSSHGAVAISMASPRLNL
jgi:hypothetical protein